GQPARRRFDPEIASATALAGLVEQAALRRRMRPALQLLVGSGACARSVGAEAVTAALRSAVAARGLAAEVVDGACNGMCYAAPLVIVRCAGSPTAMFERVSVESARALVECLAAEGADFACDGVVCDGQAWRGLAPAAEHPFWRGQTRVLLARCGLVDP